MQKVKRVREMVSYEAKRRAEVMEKEMREKARARVVKELERYKCDWQQGNNAKLFRKLGYQKNCLCPHGGFRGILLRIKLIESIYEENDYKGMINRHIN
jgi:hypothetical protein